MSEIIEFPGQMRPADAVLPQQRQLRRERIEQVTERVINEMDLSPRFQKVLGHNPRHPPEKEKSIQAVIAESLDAIDRRLVAIEKRVSA